MQRKSVVLAVLLFAAFLALSLSCGRIAGKNPSGLVSQDSGITAQNSGSVPTGADPHQQVYVDKDDPYAAQVAEYIKTGVPPLIPKWKGLYELPYVGPIRTREGIVERKSTPHPNLVIGNAATGIESVAPSRFGSKVGLGNPQPLTKGICRHAYLLVTGSGQSQSNTSAGVYEKIFGSNTGHTCPSVHDFYNEMSYGQLDIAGGAFPAAGAYNVDLTNANTIVTDAMNAANADVDFSQFDGDNDGYIDAVTIVLPFDIRAFVSFGWSGPLFDGKRIFSIGFLGESDLDPESRTAHHELGHFFLLPDYYDYGGDGGHPANPGPDGNESTGDGYWELMCAGNYTNPPMPMSAYNRWLLDWIQPTVLTNDVVGLVLPPSNLISNPTATYILWTEGVFSRQFFIIENRWLDAVADAPLANPGKGLLIWHVDENLMISPIGDGVNDIEEHKALDLEEADGFDQLDHITSFGDAGDVYPHSGKEFSFDTYPSSANYNNQDTQVRIYDISKDNVAQTVTLSAQVTSFTFDLSSLPPLIASGNVDVTPNVNSKVDRVELYLDNNLVLDSTTPPFAYTWDTTSQLFGQVNVMGIGHGGTQQRAVTQDLMVDNLPAIFPFADNAENGFFQIFPLNAHYPSTGLYAGTRKVAATPADLVAGGTGEWRQRADYHTSGSRSFYIGKGAGTYDNFENDYMITRKIDLNGVSNPTLSFNQQYDIEDGKDFARVYITDDEGASYTELLNYTGTQIGQHVTLPLSGYQGKVVRILFFFESDGAGTDNGATIGGSGWWIDDIVVSNGAAGAMPTVDITSPVAGDTVSGQLSAQVSLSGSVNRVEYTIYYAGGTLTSNAVSSPFSTTMLTSSLGNQRVLLEAKAVSSGGLYASDAVQLDLNNLVGDTNASGLVNSADMDTIRQYFGLVKASPNYRAWFDCNGDGTVDERDSSLIGYNYGNHL